MTVDPKERMRKRRIRYASKKLRDARGRLARAERSVVYWTRLLNDLKYESIRAVQLPLLSAPEVSSPAHTAQDLPLSADRSP